jgi:hypothetical protein
MANIVIAETIREQLGRGSLFMVGAKQLVAEERALRFRIMRNAKGITHVRIELASDDTYIVELLTVRGAKVRSTTVNGVYVDALHDTLERETGLAWRMPRVFHAKTGTRML